MEIKQNNVIPFLDVLLIRYLETTSTAFYCQVTNTDIYIRWKHFTPNNWKWGTLKTLLVWHAYDACSTDCYLSCDLQPVNKVFHQQNDYPIWVINKVFKKLQSKQHETTPFATDNEELNENVKIHLLLLPYKGPDAMFIISSMPKQHTCALSDGVKMTVLQR